MKPARFAPQIFAVVGAGAMAHASQLQGVPALAGLLTSALVMIFSAAAASKTASPLQVWLIGVLIAVIGLAGSPLFEDDYFRYLWDGYRTATIGSPYGIAPEHYFFDRDVPPQFRAVLDHVNNPEVVTIYGPLLEAAFYFGYLIDPANERLLRLFWAIGNLVLIALLLRQVPAYRVALYAWNPLVLKEVYLSGHPDALVPLLLCAGLLFSRKSAGARFGIALGLAAGIKIVAFAALPLLIRVQRPVLAGLAALATLVIAYLPYVALVGGQSDLSGLLVFASRWEFNPSPLFVAARYVAGETVAKAVLAVIVIGCAIWLLVRQPATHRALPPLHLVFGAVLMVAPVVNPWYLLWGLAFAVDGRSMWPWFASFALLISYATGENLGLSQIEPFAVHPLAYWIQWGVIFGALGIDFKHRPLTT